MIAMNPHVESQKGGEGKGQSLTLGSFQARVESALEVLDRQDVIRRIWSGDASVWKEESDAQHIIKNRLGWLTVCGWMRGQCEEITDFADEVKNAGFESALLLGMGGSSLAPEVLGHTFARRSGHLDLVVLDSTDPATILSVERSLDLTRTLVVVSTKSGTTTETLSLQAYFYEKIRNLKGPGAGGNFIAITDPATPLAEMAQARGFRRIFLNPPDIGGRFSALSYVGLVPAALMGVEIDVLLDRAERLIHACQSGVSANQNPCLVLGAVLGALGSSGRDKITFVLSPSLDAFGAWAEQLIAESTGKEGKGLVPVEGEPVGAPSVYGNDRLFVYMRQEGSGSNELDRKVQALEDAGHPLVRIDLSDPFDLGQEFFRWEMATAVCGAWLGVNPFDEPNVQESKDNTRRLLDEFQRHGAFPLLTPRAEEGGIALYCDHEVPSGSRLSKNSLPAYLAAFLQDARPGDYLALMAYVQRSDTHHGVLQSFRVRLRDAFRIATTLGYGPRFLHSTGQLHKGGPNSGLFIQITADDAFDLAIPGQPYTFSILKQAQALGDFLSLRRKGRRVIRFHLGPDVEAGLRTLGKALHEALEMIG
jgi:glucose-6-phosphate isomerase